MSWCIRLIVPSYIGRGGRGVIKTSTEVATRERLYTLTSNLTSLFSLQFSHWLQVRKVGTVYLFLRFFLRQDFVDIFFTDSL